MAEIGVDILGHFSKSVDYFDGQEFDFVITVTDDRVPLAVSGEYPSRTTNDRLKGVTFQKANFKTGT